MVKSLPVSVNRCSWCPPTMTSIHFDEFWPTLLTMEMSLRWWVRCEATPGHSVLWMRPIVSVAVAPYAVSSSLLSMSVSILLRSNLTGLLWEQAGDLEKWFVPPQVKQSLPLAGQRPGGWAVEHFRQSPFGRGLGERWLYLPCSDLHYLKCLHHII